MAGEGAPAAGSAVPVVGFDERLSLPGVTPLFVLIEAVANRGGAVFARAHASFDPGNANFVDGAAWYLGEVIRGANGGQWCVQPGALDVWNPHVGRPYIQHPTDAGSTAVPILDLAFMLGREGPGDLRQRYEEFAR